MPGERLRVAVVSGGRSGERDVSLATGRSVLAALGERFLVKPVTIAADGQWIVPPGWTGGPAAGAPVETGLGDSPPRSALAGAGALAEQGTDVVFNALHGPWGEDGTFQGLLRYAGLPFTGPDVVASAATIDKHLAKAALRGAGVDTPRWFALPRQEPGDGGARDWERLARERAEAVPPPWFVKPRCLGSSVGVEVLDGPGALGAWAAERARAAGDAAGDLAASPGGPPGPGGYLVEELCAGRELTCAVVDVEARPRALPPVEIRPCGSEFFDYRAKYTCGGAEEVCPAPLDPGEDARLRELAVSVHELFECGPLSRTDVFLLPDGRATVLEVNTLPGMTETSLVPLAARAAGIALGDLLVALVEHGWRRDRRFAPLRA